MQQRDLIAAKDVDLVVDDLQTERLEQARRKTPPGELFEPVVDAGNDPDVAMHGANGRMAIGEEIVPAGEHQRR